MVGCVGFFGSPPNGAIFFIFAFALPSLVVYAVGIDLAYKAGRLRIAIRVAKSAPARLRFFGVRTILEVLPRSMKYSQPILPREYRGARAWVTINDSDGFRTYRVASLGPRKANWDPNKWENRMLLGPWSATSTRVNDEYRESGFVIESDDGNAVIISEDFDEVVSSGGSLFGPGPIPV